MKIGLGTVQFGVDYGISNRDGQVAEEEVRAILAAANESGVNVIDTAFLYGDSETVLGRTLSSNMHFDVVTKTPQFAKTSLGESEAKELEESFYQSLLRLKKPSVYGVLIHRADDILVPGGELLIDRLLELKSKGLVTKIGVSVYSGEQIDKVLDRFPIDLIQLPINVLDQRLIQSGHLQKLKNTGIEVHARSAFLQGLLLMEPQHIPEYFQCIRSNLESYHHSITSKGLTPVQAALGFVSNIPEIDHIICGVNNQQQLREICAAAKVELSCADYADYAIADESIVNPALWQVGKGKK